VSTDKAVHASCRLGLNTCRALTAPGEPGRPDTSLTGASESDAIRTLAYPEMFEVVPELARTFHGRVGLVSKASPPTLEKTRSWLSHHRFLERTGVPQENLHFCLERRRKAAICETSGITHFIGDHQDVLRHLTGTTAHRYLFGAQTTPVVQRGGSVHALTWTDVSRELLGSLQ
jgi:hypothetical protein